MQSNQERKELGIEVAYNEKVQKQLEIDLKHKKSKFIFEVTHGMGKAIKENNGRVIIKKKSFKEKFFNGIKKFFTQF